MPDISADHHASTGAPLPQHPFRSRSQCFTGTAVLSSIVPSFARSFDAADGILPHHLQFASSWHFASEVFRFKGQCSAHSQENPEPGLDRTPAPSHPTGLSPVLHALRYPRSVPQLLATKRSQKKKRGQEAKSPHNKKPKKKQKNKEHAVTANSLRVSS